MAGWDDLFELLQASEQDGEGTQLDLTDNVSEDTFGKLNRKIDDALYQLRQLEIS